MHPFWLKTLAFMALTCVGLSHATCEYRREFIQRTLFSTDCAEQCASYAKKNHYCAAWEFSAKKEKCYGYIINERPRYSRTYSDCGRANGTVLTNFVETVYEAVASEPDADGCEFKAVALGMKDTKEECEQECRYLDSNVYGGCAAWLWYDDGGQCTGLLSKRGGGKDCGGV